jgi:hypothetical protein
MLPDNAILDKIYAGARRSVPLRMNKNMILTRKTIY